MSPQTLSSTSSTLTAPPSTPASPLQTSCSRAPHLSPSKRLRLLDLPDELLTHILTALCEPFGVRRRSMAQGPPAFPLAMTCTRLLSLFRKQALTTIDVLYPNKWPLPVYRTSDRHVTAQHLAAVVRLAAHNLQVLRLPSDVVELNDVLAQLAHQRIQLHELAFANIDPIQENTEKALFENSASKLRVLRIYDPRTTLKHIASACNIHELDLVGVHPQCVSELITMLPKLGHTLRLLRLAFRMEKSFAVPPINSSGILTPLWSMETFASYVSSHLANDFPNLHTLDVGGDRSCCIFHDCNADRVRVSQHLFAQDLYKKVLNVREMNSASTSPNQLRNLILRGTFDSIIPTVGKCLDEFSALVGPKVDLELQSLGATIVFPAAKEDPYFKALQINLLDLQDFPDHSEFSFNRMETLDVGSKVFIKMYSAHEPVRLRMMDFVWESTDTLRELNVDGIIDSSSLMEAICTYVGDVLEIASCVETLTFRTGLVDFADKGNSQFQRLLSFMEHIKVLCLRTHATHANDCKMAFGKNFPMFLSAISRACPDLECFHLERAYPVRRASLASPEVRHLALKSLQMCTKAAENFEETLPYCDITSVRSQLNVWREDLESTLDNSSTSPSR